MRLPYCHYRNNYKISLESQRACHNSGCALATIHCISLLPTVFAILPLTCDCPNFMTFFSLFLSPQQLNADEMKAGSAKDAPRPYEGCSMAAKDAESIVVSLKCRRTRKNILSLFLYPSITRSLSLPFNLLTFLSICQYRVPIILS